MIHPFWRFAAVTIPAKIGHDDVEALGEPRRDLMPGDVGLRPAVKQQQGTAFTTVNKIDGRGARLKDVALEAGEKR